MYTNTPANSIGKEPLILANRLGPSETSTIKYGAPEGTI